MIAITLLSVASVLAPAQADINKTIENALKFGQDGKYGQVKFNSRIRYENANTSDTTNKTAEALTLRIRLGYLTPEFNDLQAYAELEVNQDVGVNDYNSVRNGKTQYDVIADPQEKELNRFWISYKGIPDTLLKVGRQRIQLDNQRFIGNVPWRQLEQTFDAGTITNASLPNTTFKAGYIINSRDIVARENDMDTGFANLAYTIKDIGKLTAYSYLIDFNESKAQNTNSNQTYGGRFDGDFQLNDDFKALYTAEYAWQKDHGDNPIDYQVSYYNFIVGLSAFGITFKGGIEQLDGQNGKGFSTPLATNHAFQGWADLFLATPKDGIRDLYGLVSTKFMGVKLLAVYHDFDDDTGNIDYGSEWDFLITKKFGKHYSLLAKYAYYNADAFKTDTQKIWVQAGISF